MSTNSNYFWKYKDKPHHPSCWTRTERQSSPERRRRPHPPVDRLRVQSKQSIHSCKSDRSINQSIHRSIERSIDRHTVSRFNFVLHSVPEPPASGHSRDIWPGCWHLKQFLPRRKNNHVEPRDSRTYDCMHKANIYLPASSTTTILSPVLNKKKPRHIK